MRQSWLKIGHAPVVSEQYMIAYFPVPKCGSTTLRHIFYELEFGEPFCSNAHQNVDIARFLAEHAVARGFGERESTKLEGYWKFTVVREPVKRLVSAYANRVLHLRDLEKAWARASWKQRLKDRLRGLKPNPSIEYLIDRMELYQERFGTIRNHFSHISVSIGHDLSRLDAIYRLEDMPQLLRDLTDRVGDLPAVPAMKSEGIKLQLDDVPPRAREKLVKYARPDYQLLRDYYPYPHRQQRPGVDSASFGLQ